MFMWNYNLENDNCDGATCYLKNSDGVCTISVATIHFDEAKVKDLLTGKKLDTEGTSMKTIQKSAENVLLDYWNTLRTSLNSYNDIIEENIKPIKVEPKAVYVVFHTDGEPYVEVTEMVCAFETEEGAQHYCEEQNEAEKYHYKKCFLK